MNKTTKSPNRPISEASSGNGKSHLNILGEYFCFIVGCAVRGIRASLLPYPLRYAQQPELYARRLATVGALCCFIHRIGRDRFYRIGRGVKSKKKSSIVNCPETTSATKPHPPLAMS